MRTISPEKRINNLNLYCYTTEKQSTQVHRNPLRKKRIKYCWSRIRTNWHLYFKRVCFFFFVRMFILCIMSWTYSDYIYPYSHTFMQRSFRTSCARKPASQETIRQREEEKPNRNRREKKTHSNCTHATKLWTVSNMYGVEKPQN